MKLTISHDFDTDVDTFWNKLFLDPEFNRALYKVGLQFPNYELLEESDKGDTLVRRVRVTPKQDAPAAVQKMLGGTFSYTEEGTYDKVGKRYRFKIVPASMADKVKTEGVLRADPLSPKRMKRVLDMTIDVKIFGIGGMIEGFVAKSTQDSYALAAAFTNKWIAEKGL